MYKTTSNINPQYMSLKFKFKIFKLKGNKRLFQQSWNSKFPSGTKSHFGKNLSKFLVQKYGATIHITLSHLKTTKFLKA